MNELHDHIVSSYGDDLDKLTARIGKMGGHVEAMVKDAIKAMRKRDSALAEDVIARDKLANSMQEDIDADVIRILALRHPMAADLRRVVGATRVASDLERIGDLAEGIARRAIKINQDEIMEPVHGIARMGKLVLSVLRDSIDALMANDTDQAIQVWLRDKEVDEMYNSLFRELLTYMMGDPRTIGNSAHLLFTAKNLERIGDHASNIAEVTHFIVKSKALVDRLNPDDKEDWD